MCHSCNKSYVINIHYHNYVTWVDRQSVADYLGRFMFWFKITCVSLRPFQVLLCVLPSVFFPPLPHLSPSLLARLTCSSSCDKCVCI